MGRMRTCTTRTRGGCVTCKHRRKKCDEQRPICGNCVSSRRICQGYDDPFRLVNKVTWGRLDRALQAPPFSPGFQLAGESNEHRIASFHCLSGAIFSHIDQNLVYEVLRRNTSQHSIQHALLALSVQLEAFSRNHRMRDIDHMNIVYSLNHYGKSLRGVHNSLESNMHIEQKIETLFALSLIISYELLRGDGPAALAHLQGALCVLSTSAKPPSPKGEESAVVEALNVLFLRLEVGALSFAGALSPRISTSSLDCVSQRAEHDLVKARFPEIRAFQAIRTKFLCLKFRSLQAMGYNTADNRPVSFYGQGSHEKNQNLREAVLVDLRYWLQLFQPALDTVASPRPSDDAMDPRIIKECLILHIHYLILVTLISSFCPEPRETAFDAFEASFDTLIGHARTLVIKDQHCLFTLDMGLIEPLYLTVLKCREPSQRLLALKLLSSCRQEGAWDGPLMTSIAQQAISIEAGLVRAHRYDVYQSESGRGSLFDDAKVIWDFREDPEAELCRVSAVALPSINWGHRNALVEFYHQRGRERAICEVSMDSTAYR